MSAEIVDITPKKAQQLVWICGRCSAQSWYLYNDNTCECTACGNKSDSGEWRKNLGVDPDAVPEKDNDSCLVRHVHASESISIARTRKRLKDLFDEEAMAFVVMIKDDSARFSWSSISSETQKAWLLRQMATAIEDIKAEEYQGDPKTE